MRIERRDPADRRRGSDETPTDVGAPFAPPAQFEEYTLRRLLGQGAMGQVWLAEDRLLERLVAVKWIAMASPTPSLRASFFQEARAVARLTHPNVVTIYRVGEVGSRPFLISEYLRGQTLAELEKPLPDQRVLDIGVQLARGLAAAHGQSILHRDIKPANAMLSDNGVAKLLDFGLADVGPARAGGTSSAKLIIHRDAQDATSTISVDQLQEVGGELAPGFARNERHLGFAGTPAYAAPELFEGEPASTRSDVYSFGLVLFELAAGRLPERDATTGRLIVGKAPLGAASLREAVPDADSRLCEIVDRCLQTRPEDRFASGEDLCASLERAVAARAPGPVTLPKSNPFRGLLPFEAEHRSLFFGRAAEIRSILDRLSWQGLVVVSGESGVGKSSLCRAGAIPWIREDPESPPWRVVGPVIPGKTPLRALAASLAPHLEWPERAIVDRLREEPRWLVRALTKLGNSRVLLFIDQLEELTTMAEEAESAVVARAIASVAEAAGRARILATARADRLGRLAALPDLGDRLGPSLFLLKRMSPSDLRETITGPLAAFGLRTDPPSLVEALLSEAAGTGAGLAMLQFALAALWDARDTETGTLRESDLRAMGGVAGALSRHADAVVNALSAAERGAARRLLVSMVDSEGTGERLSEADLLSAETEDPMISRRALEALVRGRLVVVSEPGAGDPSYSLAHEALATSWDTLRGWIGQGTTESAQRGRLRRAAAEWEQGGKRPELLWDRRMLREVASVDPQRAGARELAFLAASRRSATRSRLARWGLAGAALTAMIGVGGAARYTTLREREQWIEDHKRTAVSALEEAREAARRAHEARTAALAKFDVWDEAAGEDLWAQGESDAEKAASFFAEACQSFEVAAMLSGGRQDLKDALATALDERAKLAEEVGDLQTRDDLLRRLPAYDSGDARHALWTAPGMLSVETSSPAEIRMRRIDSLDGRRVEGAESPLGRAPIARLSVPPGSVLLRIRPLRQGGSEADDPDVLFPLFVGRGSEQTLSIRLPEKGATPRGFVYVAEGAFFFGSPEPNPYRKNNERHPQHQRSTKAFFIARHEVTFDDWIVYLNALPQDQRPERTPKVKDELHGIVLEPDGEGHYRLLSTPSATTYEAHEGEPIRYRGRDRRSEQDWLKMPVSGMTYPQAMEYAAWLSSTGKVPGARLCTALEWERAARGADTRIYPHGDVLATDDANHDATYGRVPEAFGPDEVGSHPASRSPFGADDMAGNIWEWTSPFHAGGSPLIRGGGYYQMGADSRVFNFEKLEMSFRSAVVGIRLCATAPWETAP